MLEQATVVDAQRGGNIGVSARKFADEQIVIAGGQVRATRYTLITPYLAGTIWYDKANLWVRGELERDGSKVESSLRQGIAVVYHPVGNAICRMFNLGDKHQAMPCVALSSDGSVANIRRIESGESNFGLSQTDVAYAAFHGEGPFAAAGPDPKLRMLIALYREAFTSSLAPMPASAISRICAASASASRRAVSDITSLTMSCSDFMARRCRVLSAC
jgi:hypothetical protein